MPPMPSSRVPDARIPRVNRPRPVVIPEHGVVVMESRHGPGFLAELNDDHAKFHLVIDGHARWTGNGQEFRVEPGTLFFIAARIPHRQQDVVGAPLTLHFIHFRHDLLPARTYAALSSAGMRSINLPGSGTDVERRVHVIFHEMLAEQGSMRPGWEAVLHARLLELTVMSLRFGDAHHGGDAAAHPAGGDSAQRVAAYARRQESAFDVRESVDAAAVAVHLSRRRFTELFRSVTGETWIRRQSRLRLEHACRLLATTESPVTAVAFASGYEDLSHFHHAFKRGYGCTPLEFRDRHRPIRQS